MAIPVQDAPPPYAPPKPAPRPPSHEPDGSLDDLRRIGPSDPRVRQVRFSANLGRGCGFIAIATIVSLCVLSGFLAWMLVGFAQHEYATQAGRITEVLRETARNEGRESTVDSDLTAFDALLRADRVSIYATAALVQRHALAKRDERIDPEELDRMMEVVHDAVIHDGEVDPARYPELQNPTF